MFAPERGLRDGKKSYDALEGKKRREDHMLSLRTRKRDDLLQKRREEASAAAADEVRPQYAGGSLVPTAADNAPLPPLSEVYTLLASSDPVVALRGSVFVRRYLAHSRDPPTDEVITHGNGWVISRLIEFLGPDVPADLQFEAAWTLTNIASGESHHTAAVVGALPHLFNLLFTSTPQVYEQTLWAIGNITGDGPATRDLVIQSGGVDVLKRCIATPSSLRHTRLHAWIACNFTRFEKCPPPAPEAMLQLLPAIAQLIMVDDEATTVDTIWAVSHIVDMNVPVINDALLGYRDMFARVIRIASLEPNDTTNPAVRIIGTMTHGTDEATQLMLDLGALPVLRALLATKDDDVICKEICWTVCNLAAGTASQVQAAVDSGIFIEVIAKLGSSHREVVRDAAWAVTNLSLSADISHTVWLLEHGALRALVALINLPSERIIHVALQALDRLLANGRTLGTGDNAVADEFERLGGVDRLDVLWSNAKQDVATLAGSILELHWPSADDFYDDKFGDDDDAMDDAAQTGFPVETQAADAAALGDVDISFS